MFKGKSLLITGGTGSFGNAVLESYLESDIAEIRIFSRDEKKQDDMRKKYNNSKLKFYIGDVRDYQSVLSASKDVDYIFHSAALKQVPSCEFYPLEAVKTNVLGTENVLEAAITNNIKKVICLSTDKAVYPINAMGISKAMMEKVAIAKSRQANNTQITITRYGNVMASRGSVIPLFVDQIVRGKHITITDPHMTRFMMSLGDAVSLVEHAFRYGKSGEVFVQKSPACTLETLAEAITSLFKVDKKKVKIIGTRHGEKLHETLLSREEFSVAKSTEKYFSVAPDVRDLNYEKFFTIGEEKLSLAEDYNSSNTKILNTQEMIALLNKLPFIKESLNNYAK